MKETARRVQRRAAGIVNSLVDFRLLASQKQALGGQTMRFAVKYHPGVFNFSEDEDELRICIIRQSDFPGCYQIAESAKDIKAIRLLNEAVDYLRDAARSPTKCLCCPQIVWGVGATAIVGAFKFNCDVPAAAIVMGACETCSVDEQALTIKVDETLTPLIRSSWLRASSPAV